MGKAVLHRKLVTSLGRHTKQHPGLTRGEHGTNALATQRVASLATIHPTGVHGSFAVWRLSCRIANPTRGIVATLRGLNALEEPLDGHISDHHQAAFVQPLCNFIVLARLRVCVCK